MQLFPAKKLGITGREQRFKLFAIGTLISVPPLVTVSCILNKNQVAFESMIYFVLAFLFVLSSSLDLRRVFNKHTIATNTIDTDTAIERHPIDTKKGATGGIRKKAVPFNTIMKRWEEASPGLRKRVFGLFATKEPFEIAGRSPHIDDLLDTLLEKAMTVSKAQMGSVYMVEPEKKRFRVVASRGFCSGPMKDSYISFRESLARLVVSDRKPLILQDTEPDSAPGRANDLRFMPSSFLSMPVFVGDDLIATLNLSYIDSGHELILSTMIGETAFALQNAMLFSEVEGHLKSLQEPTVKLSAAGDQLQRAIAEKAPAEEEMTRLNAAFEQSIDGIALGDAELKISYVNNAFAKMHGYSPEEMVGLAAVDLQNAGNADESKAMTRHVRKQGSWSGKTRHIRKDGEPFPVYMSVTSLRDDEGNPTGTLTVLRDITAQEDLEAKLHHIQKLDALGTFSGGVAHNFNNLLMGIMGNVSLALLTSDPGDEHNEALKKIEMLVEKGAQLTKQLLVVAGKKGMYEVKPITLNRVLTEACDAFAATNNEITVHRDLAEDSWRIEADQGQIEQALWNLFINAADAMPDGGEIYMKTMNVTHKDLQAKAHNPKPGNYIRLSLQDTGMGMDKETRERLFDPFFSTKDLCSGTGLGLAFVHGVIKAHGGYIFIDSEKGRGTVFDIYLPALNGKTTKEKEFEQVILKGNECVLLIDDEDMILDVGKHMLSRLGYEVLLAGSGKEALGIYEKYKDNIALIILDMIMPNMSGGETFERLRELNSQVKVLLSSGYSIDGQATEILNRGCNGFIQKPFTVTALSRKLREILDQNH